MKKILILLFFAFVSLQVSAQYYRLRYDSVGIVSKLILNTVTTGSSTDSILVKKANGGVYKIAQSTGGGTIGYAFGNYVGRDGSAGISFDSGLNGRIYTNGNLDLIVSANESITAATGGLLLKVRNGNGITIDVNRNINIPLLATGLTPPTTSGTTMMVVADANGKLSIKPEPSAGGVSSVSAGLGMSFSTITSTGSVGADTTVLRTVANSFTKAQAQPRITLTTTGSGASTFNAGTGALNIPTPTTAVSGAYTPTLTNGVNFSGLTLSYANYIRVGNQVTVFGTFRTNFTSGATFSQVYISLPIASALVYDIDLSGHGASITNPGNKSIVSVISADTAGGRAFLTVISDATDITTQDFKYSFTYTVI